MAFEDTTKAAKRILREVKTRGVSTTLGDVTVKHYANGREQGFHLVVYTWKGNDPVSRAVSFAEARGSDQLVVYTGRVVEFGIGSAPNEARYRDAKYFSHDDAYGAARFIVAYLEGRA